jgi:hypothetical protein
LSVDDPIGAAGGRKGVRTDGRQVSAARRFRVGEGQSDIRSDIVGLLREFSDQAVEKHSRVFRGRFTYRRINVFGNHLDGEEDRRDLGKDVIGRANFDGGDFKQ